MPSSPEPGLKNSSTVRYQLIKEATRDTNSKSAMRQENNNKNNRKWT